MADFNVQRGQAALATTDTSKTLTAGTDYTAPASSSKAFARIVAAQLCGDGQTDSFSGQIHKNTIGLNATAPITSLVFARNSAADVQAVNAQWEMPEYIGAAGGAHEFVVRKVEVLTLGSSAVTADSATISGIVDVARCVVFITSQAATSGGRAESEEYEFTAEMIAGPKARVTRGTAPDRSATCSIAVVEFTGSAWSVQRIEHTMAAADTDEAVTITSVGALSRAFGHFQHRSAGDSSDTAGAHQTWLSDATTVKFRVETLPSGASICVAWIVSNSQTGTGAMNVQHSGALNRANGAGSSPDTWTVTITAVASMANTSIMGECSTTPTAQGGDTNRLSVGFRLTATTTVTVSRGYIGGDRDYRFQVVEWPYEASSNQSVSVGPASATWAGVAPTPSLGGLSVAAGPASGAWAGVAPSAILGALSVTPAPAVGIWTGVAQTPSLGGLAVTTGPAAGTWAGVAPTVSIGGLAVAPGVALGSWQAVDLGAAFGAITAAVGPALGTWTGVAPTPFNGISISVAPAIGAWVAIAPTPVLTLSQSVGPALGAWSGGVVTVQFGPLVVAVLPAIGSWTALGPILFEGVIIREILDLEAVITRTIYVGADITRLISNNTEVF